MLLVPDQIVLASLQSWMAELGQPSRLYEIYVQDNNLSINSQHGC